MMKSQAQVKDYLKKDKSFKMARIASILKYLDENFYKYSYHVECNALNPKDA